jgi:hypothetical protein
VKLSEHDKQRDPKITDENDAVDVVEPVGSWHCHVVMIPACDEE